MSQHDFNIANQGFPATRSDINNALAALASTSSGTSEPSTTYANQFWYDTTNNLLKFRNEADSAWITLAYLDQGTNEWEIRSAVIQAVDSAGISLKTDDGTARVVIQDDGDVAFDTDTLFVDAANNRIGIGTANPTDLLHAVGNGTIARLSGSGGDFHGLQIQCSDASGSAAKSVFIDALNENGAAVANMQAEVQSDGGSFWSWSTQPSGARTDRRVERIRIDGSGNIAAGGTSANGRFTVKETGLSTGTSLGNAAIMTYGSFGGGIAMLDSNDPNSGTGYLIWVDDSGNDFNIAGASTGTAASGGVYINNNAGSWSSRSDERDKINLEPITDAVTKVQSIRAVIGEYVWAEGVRHPFLIAQDVEAVLPEAVSIANKSAPEEDQRLGMSYTDMVPLLTAALQEAITKIEDLEARVAALESA